ncbi:MAG: class I SAM-dependent methyltransferase [Streptosporangiales bacterium]
MNENHAKLCPSPEWAAHLHEEVLSDLIDGIDLGDVMLEVGPGRGAATDWLRHRVGRLVAVERDADAADVLAAKQASGNVEVVRGDGARLDFDDATFDAAGCFTMLHHMRTAAEQDALLVEMRRVLRPGGVLVGSDSLPSDELERFHEGDTYNPVDPATFHDRLRRGGFERVTVRADKWLAFVAYAPVKGSSWRETTR